MASNLPIYSKFHQTFALVDHQTDQNLFGGQQYPQSIFQCLDLSFGNYVHPSESADELVRSQDIIVRSVEQGGQNAQQETKMDQEEEHPGNGSDNGSSIKQNFCKYLGKNVRRIIIQQVSNDVPQLQGCYLRFMLTKKFKNTRKSLRQFLINQPRPALYEKFKQFLKLDMSQLLTKSLEIFQEGTEYLRRLICSKQTQIKAQAKTQTKKEEFRLFVQRTIQELRENRMRGKDDKKLRRERLKDAIENPAKEKKRRSTHKIITNLLILENDPKLVDLQCFPAE